MQPYYDDGQITIYHGDCRDVLPTLAPGSVDLVLTDPPYGIALANHGRLDGHRTDRDWTVNGDRDQEVGNAILALCEQKVWPIIAFASPKNPWSGHWRQHLVWDKGPAVGGGGDTMMCWKFDWELLQVRAVPSLIGQRDSSVLRYWVGPQDSQLHPCQKPVPLLRYLIGKACPSGGVVLDPFCGSGSTLRAAKDLGRKAIGIEIEERFCEVAVGRLAQTAMALEV